MSTSELTCVAKYNLHDVEIRRRAAWRSVTESRPCADYVGIWRVLSDFACVSSEPACSSVTNWRYYNPLKNVHLMQWKQCQNPFCTFFYLFTIISNGEINFSFVCISFFRHWQMRTELGSTLSPFRTEILFSLNYEYVIFWWRRYFTNVIKIWQLWPTPIAIRVCE